MEKKPSSFSFFFKRLNYKKGSGGGGGGSWRWRNRKSSTGVRWKKKFNLHLWLVDSFLFKIVSVFEAIVLVSKLCFFFVCCGCHFWYSWLAVITAVTNLFSFQCWSHRFVERPYIYCVPFDLDKECSWLVNWKKSTNINFIFLPSFFFFLV